MSLSFLWEDYPFISLGDRCNSWSQYNKVLLFKIWRFNWTSWLLLSWLLHNIDNFWTNAPIFIFYLFIFLLERSSFSGSTTVKSVAIRQFKVCLSVCLNICLGCKSCKNWSVTKIGYVFHGSNLHMYTKNCEHILDTFCRATSKPRMFVFFF